MDNTYTVKPETVKNWKGDTKTLWYGYRNGWYVVGTTSKTREESVKLISNKFNCDKSKIL